MYSPYEPPIETSVRDATIEEIIACVEGKVDLSNATLQMDPITFIPCYIVNNVKYSVESIQDIKLAKECGWM